jgi:hypothetical protein
MRFAAFIQWTPSYDSNTKIGTASIVETSSYLIAACLLSMRPLVQRFIGSVTSTSNSWSRSLNHKGQQKSGTKDSGFESGKERAHTGALEDGWVEMGEEDDTRKLVVERGDEGKFELRRPEQAAYPQNCTQ